MEGSIAAPAVRENLIKEERTSGGVLDIDTEKPSSITSHSPGYIDRKNEIIFGLSHELLSEEELHSLALLTQ